MNDDIVARLRILASEFPTVNGWMDNEWTNAADEIERLRAELRTYTGDKHTTREPFEASEPFTPEAL